MVILYHCISNIIPLHNPLFHTNFLSLTVAPKSLLHSTCQYNLSINYSEKKLLDAPESTILTTLMSLITPLIFIILGRVNLTTIPKANSPPNFSSFPYLLSPSSKSSSKINITCKDLFLHLCLG